MINKLLDIALFFRFKQKFWVDLYWWKYHRDMKKLSDSIKTNTNSVSFINKIDKEIEEINKELNNNQV